MSEGPLIIMIVTAVFAVIVAQLLSLAKDNRHVAVRCEVDMTLTEPDEVFVLTYRIRNTGLWPILFANVSFSFDDGVEIREDKAWKTAHAGSSGGNLCSFNVSLTPRRVIRGRIHLSLRSRGAYRLGRIYVETGDFLGFTSRIRTINMDDQMVCTARLLPEDPALEPFGGYLGDVSVRRFIFEDPSLILGYRDYTGAEPMKRISWTQTARTGQMMVKKHDFTVDADVAVLMDEQECAPSVAEHCLSMLRTVCDRLEAAKIPYALLSNGDLLGTEKGVGRMHSFEIQRRIGLSRFIRYRRIEEYAAQFAHGELIPRGWIVITPKANQSLRTAISELQTAGGGRVCLLTGEEARSDA